MAAGRRWCGSPSPSGPALAASQQVGVGRALRVTRQPRRPMPSWVTRAPRLPSAILNLLLAFWALPRPSVFLAWTLWGWVSARLGGGWAESVTGPPAARGIWSARGPSWVPGGPEGSCGASWQEAGVRGPPACP